MNKAKVAKALQLAAKHDKAAKANGWRDNEVTERTQAEYNAVEKTLTAEERAMLRRLL